MPSFNLIDKAFLLKKSPLFEALDLDLLLSIADKIESSHYRPNDMIFQCGQDAQRLYLIVSGEISIEDRNGIELARLLPGEYFGDEAMFTEKRREYSAICRSKAELFSLSRSHLLSIFQECPSVALSFLEAYTCLLVFRAR
jgi:CRP-like cAMP-binding protein